MNYNLAQLFDHPLKFRYCIPSAIVTFGGSFRGDYKVDVSWKRSASDSQSSDQLILSWDTKTIRNQLREVEDEIEILKSRDEDRETRIELTAVVVAVAVMANIEPQSLFTYRLAPGRRHDYCLNETTEEMIEIAGRWEAGLPGLFEEKKSQSDKNQTPKKRWISVTIIHATPRNRTEGLHK